MTRTPLELNPEAQILALTASIERLEALPHPRRNPELVKRLRRHRGAFKLYRDGVFNRATAADLPPADYQLRPLPRRWTFRQKARPNPTRFSKSMT